MVDDSWAAEKLGATFFFPFVECLQFIRYCDMFAFFSDVVFA